MFLQYRYKHTFVLSENLGQYFHTSVAVSFLQAKQETQTAAIRYERACSQLAAAKEMVNLAEQGFFKKGQSFDPAWQEMLNHATMKVRTPKWWLNKKKMLRY